VTAPTAVFNVTGFVGGGEWSTGAADGQFAYIENNTAYVMTLSNANGGSTSGNQILTCSGADYAIPAGYTALLAYNSGTTSWHQLCDVAASGAQLNVANTWTANQTFPAGAAGGASLIMAGDTTAGLYRIGSTSWCWTSGSNCQVQFGSAKVEQVASGVFGWAASTAASAAFDTGISRDSGGVVDIGTGAQGSKAGSLNLAGITNTGNYTEAYLLLSATAPTITSGFNTSGFATSGNGTAAFTVTIGTGGATNTGVLGMPTATHGWNCSANNLNRGAYIQMTANGTAAVTLTNYGTTVGTPVNWTNSDVIAISCFAY
jgi:hypothetical protein